MKRKLVVAPALAIMLAGFVLAAHADPPAVHTFDGAPSAPLAFSSLDWDVQVHSRDQSTWYALETMQAQHGPDCGAPPATHEIHTYEDAVFQCRDHLMTAIKASGYGVVYLTPNQMLDFGAGGTVDFELSTERLSQRDWPDLWITPWADNMALPFDWNSPDLQGPPRNAIHISMENGQFAPLLSVQRDGVRQEWWTGFGTPLNQGITAGTNQSATRQPFRLTVEPGRVKFERLASATGTAVTFFDQSFAPLAWDTGVVQFGHHSYNPTKCNGGGPVCPQQTPGTWHWDNIAISPAVPFTMVKANQRFVDGAGGVMTFAAPAPAGAFVRFAAICRPTVNGVAVTPQIPTLSNDHFASYFVPIAAGATSVNIGFGPDGWYTGPCFAKDFSAWSQEGTPSTPTPSPPSPTATSSATPIPTATLTATPTPTAAPATATPTDTAPAVNSRCTVRDRNDANSGWAEVEGRWVSIGADVWTCGVTRAGRNP